MSIMNSSGEDGNIVWSVTFTDHKTFLIEVSNTNSGLNRSTNYFLIYDPVFGLDCLDSFNINVILENFILELKD